MKASARREPPDPEPLLTWAERPPALAPGAGLRALAWALPIAMIGTFIAWRLAGLPFYVWMTLLLVQLVVVGKTGVAAAEAFAAVSATEGTLKRFAPMLGLIETLSVPSPRLIELRASVTGGAKPSQALRALWRIADWFALRENGMVYPFINVLLLWDLHCTLRLDRWKERHGAQLRPWFLAVGELEALSSLAGFAADEPGRCWPELVDEGVLYEAEGLGHPLVEFTQRVGNEVRLSAAGTGLLITGSNMSGKSTLLRAMGLGAVMARAGAPVVARRLRLSRLALGTSICVRDSLEAGVSHFYAELRKLREVLDQAEAGPTLFLLDEILHGTNSVERQVGARWLFAELLRLGSLGAISTHDTELCRLGGDFAHRVELVHLRESVADGVMTFDYRLRPGPVTAGNALRLMRQVGLAVPEPVVVRDPADVA